MRLCLWNLCWGQVLTNCTLHAELAPILQVIFQKSLDSGKLPHIWKEANVSPIFKKGDKSYPANYRPISLTYVLCKVLKHIVASNLTKHLANSNILFELQHGFNEKRSCETQLVILVDEIAKTCRWGNKCLVRRATWMRSGRPLSKMHRVLCGQHYQNVQLVQPVRVRS